MTAIVSILQCVKAIGVGAGEDAIRYLYYFTLSFAHSMGGRSSADRSLRNIETRFREYFLRFRDYLAKLGRVFIRRAMRICLALMPEEVRCLVMRLQSIEGSPISAGERTVPVCN